MFVCFCVLRVKQNTLRMFEMFKKYGEILLRVTILYCLVISKGVEGGLRINMLRGIWLIFKFRDCQIVFMTNKWQCIIINVAVLTIFHYQIIKTVKVF